jgi:hypothetical protein
MRGEAVGNWPAPKNKIFTAETQRRRENKVKGKSGDAEVAEDAEG